MKGIFTAMATAAILATATQATAQQQSCAARDAVVGRLVDRRGEIRQSIGLAPQDRMVEVFASTETGTWTITVTMPNGVTCLVASDQAYEAVAEEPQPAGVKSWCQRSGHRVKDQLGPGSQEQNIGDHKERALRNGPMRDDPQPGAGQGGGHQIKPAQKRL